jgi:putative phosphoesterase
MKLAVLGDIHSNLAALEAVLTEVSRAGAERLLHTGGLVGFGARPNETIDLVRARGIEGVRGHFDESVAWAERPTAPSKNGSRAAGASSERALAWNSRAIGFSQRQFLKDLPFSHQIRAGERLVMLFHASPIDIYQGIDEDAAEPWLEELAGETGADVHLFGHTHRPFHRIAAGRHFINAGSVGRPQDGDARACVALVELNRDVRVEFRRVAYDIERTMREIEVAGLASDSTRSLRLGR